MTFERCICARGHSRLYAATYDQSNDLSAGAPFGRCSFTLRSINYQVECGEPMIVIAAHPVVDAACRLGGLHAAHVAASQLGGIMGCPWEGDDYHKACLHKKAS